MERESENIEKVQGNNGWSLGQVLTKTGWTVYYIYILAYLTVTIYAVNEFNKLNFSRNKVYLLFSYLQFKPANGFGLWLSQ